MKKKQLEQQNIALFAEVERKSSEISTLTLRLEELRETYDSLLAQKEELNSALKTLQQEYNMLSEHNQQLAQALQEFLYSTPNQSEPDNVNIALASETEGEAQTEATESPSLIAEEISEPSAVNAESVLSESVDTLEHSETIDAASPSEPAIPTEITPSTPLSQANIDLLRAHAAELIGSLTRQTASLLSHLENVGGTNAEAAKTLLLGKNESFKYKILTVLNSNGSTEELQTKMDRLAEETAAYLTASCEGI